MRHRKCSLELSLCPDPPRERHDVFRRVSATQTWPTRSAGFDRGRRMAPPRSEQAARLRGVELGRNCTFEIIAHDFREAFLGGIPAFVANANAPKQEDRLLSTFEVLSGASGLV